MSHCLRQHSHHVSNWNMSHWLRQHSHHVRSSAEETGSSERISCRLSPCRGAGVERGWRGAWFGGRGTGRGCRPAAVGVSAQPAAACDLRQSGELAACPAPEQHTVTLTVRAATCQWEMNTMTDNSPQGTSCVNMKWRNTMNDNTHHEVHEVKKYNAWQHSPWGPWSEQIPYMNIK